MERLWKEVEALRADAVESLLRAGQPPDPRRGPPPGETPLLYVTSQGCGRRDPESKGAAVATALALIRQKADVNAAGDNGLTPLLHAAYACPPEVVVALMKAGADTRARTRGDASALALAIVDDRADNVKAMLDAGYDVARERAELTTFLSGKPQIKAMVDEVLDRSAPPDAAVQWKDIEIRARLDGDGVLHVNELVWLEAIGDVTTVERFVRGWVGTGVQVSRVARIEASGREARVLSPGSLDAADRYEWVDGQSLRWSVRGPQEAAFAVVTRLGYRIEYTVSGAVIPIWGVRPFSSATILSLFVLHPVRRGEELWQAWRLAPGAWRSRYLVDHDFSPFPFLATTTVDRVSLLMAFDRAWGGQEAPFREWRPVPAGGDAREAVPLDFRGTGVPAAIDPTLHMSWLGPLGLLPLVSVALWAGLVFRQWRRRRRFDETPVDASWIGVHLVTRAPDEIAQVLSGPDEGFSYPGAAAILEGMARQMKIEFHDEPDRGTLRLRVPRASLTPWERAIVEQLFGVGDVAEEPAVRSRLEAGTIDPEGAARRAYEAARFNRRWRFSPRAVPTLVLIVLGVGLMLTVLAAGGFQALVVGLVLGSVIYQPMRPAAARWGRSPDLPLLPLGVLIVPALAFSAVLIVFFLSVPAYPRALIGLASLWLGLTNSLVNGAKPLGSESEIEARHGLARARRHITAELRKPFPNLEDTWLPWILALDLGDEVAAWRERKPTDPSQVPDPEAYAFMGRWRGGSATAPSMTRWAARFLATPRA